MHTDNSSLHRLFNCMIGRQTKKRFVACRLPGSAVSERTMGQAAMAAANGPAGGSKVALGHCGIHWVGLHMHLTS